ncbi:hypothetical protein DR864_03380 [Runella rosea]|uniref:Uncharacterized protein n=1 Tax=Runella rosea TaxID=2259595 RepID=A0A344TDX3_9BACT|nr:hypothetical protein [Runella rosea]AXE16844.1 hypothetical protein DR864_03380 [Runella rosea]
MNFDEIKPLWESYKEQVDEECRWTSAELRELIKGLPKPIPWYRKAQRPMLQFCVSIFLITITSGC